MPTPVTLELVTPYHADAVQRLAAHPDVVATTNLPEPYPDDGAAQWIEYVQPRHAAGEEFAFAIMNEGSELVGVTGLVDVTATEAELGFWIEKPYWNRGYATAGAQRPLAPRAGEAGLPVPADRDARASEVDRCRPLRPLHPRPQRLENSRLTDADAGSSQHGLGLSHERRF